MERGRIWTIGSILKWSKQYFEKRGIDTPRLDAEVLLSHVLDVKRIYLYAHFDQPLDPAELAAYHEAVKRRAAHEPVAYIVGRRAFMDLTLTITPAVLVPQPDTETLVGAVMDRLKGTTGETVADIGTGSGVIALALLYYLPALRAVASDISTNALTVARDNADRLGFADRVEFFEGDLVAPLQGRTFDAVVSNPPYIPRTDFPTLPLEVMAEPRLAIDGGADGLDFYRRLVVDVPPLLKPNGFLAVEIGMGQAPAVQALARDAGWQSTEIVKDLSGIERVVVMRRD
ncbi:MAG: peptide chain release factor N(5)-glutamine methyltransferase [Schwartzia sp.]|nr:peptide chain release factor N(5)-glutamine methyltransferase [Schwartzia sp. (in: firmicutes)]